MTSYCCVRCNSDAIQKLSLIHSSGTTAGTSTSTGVGLVGGRLAVGASSGVSRSQSALASQYAPPQKQTVAKEIAGMSAVFWIVALVVAVSFNLGIVVFWISTGLAIAGAAAMWSEAASYNRTAFPVKYLQWTKQYLCLRCGHVFELLPSSATQIPPADSPVAADGAPAVVQAQPSRIMLAHAGPRKISVIKALCDTTEMSPREAASLVERAPVELPPHDNAELMIQHLREADALVTVDCGPPTSGLDPAAPVSAAAPTKISDKLVPASMLIAVVVLLIFTLVSMISPKQTSTGAAATTASQANLVDRPALPDLNQQPVNQPATQQPDAQPASSPFDNETPASNQSTGADPYASGQQKLAANGYETERDQLLKTVQSAFFAAGCNVIRQEPDATVLTLNQEKQLQDEADAERVTVDPQVLRQVSDAAHKGLDQAKQGCGFWENDPEAVQAMRDEVRAAEASP